MILCIPAFWLSACSNISEPEYEPQRGWPESVTREDSQLRYKHGANPEMALSPDGRYILVPYAHASANTMLLIDAASGTASKFVYPDQSFKLQHPAFSTSGDKLAFVLTPYPYMGVSDILVTDFNASIQYRVDECRKIYAHPQFSPDGQNLLYFRDVLPQATDPAHDAQRSAIRQITWSVFERALARNSERQLIDLAWTSIGWLSYSYDGQRVFLRAHNAQGRSIGSASGEEYWSPLGEAVLDRKQRLALGGTVSIQQTAGYNVPPEEVEHSVDSSTHGAVAGDLLIRTVYPSEDRPWSDLVLMRSGRELSKTEFGYHIKPAISRNGCAISYYLTTDSSETINYENSCSGLRVTFDGSLLMQSARTIAIEEGFKSTCRVE